MSDTGTSGQATAKRALVIASLHGFEVPSALGRRHLAMAFAGAGRVVYGRAFDCLRCTGDPLDLENLEQVQDRLKDVTLCEVKSTRKSVKEDFGGYFFSISTAELLVAQSLGTQFRFLFVDTLREAVLELTLQEVFARSKNIYPNWSIQF